MDIIGKIHSVETCGTVDGPGIRYVVFLQGCPLRCEYCHNPDTWDINSKNLIKMPASELLADITKYKSYFKYSGGGVTLTGGEPLMQREFAAALFKACKEEGIHNALDTSGYTGVDTLTKEVLKYTDLVILDIKSINANTFKKTTGVPIDNTLQFAKYLHEENISAQIRFVLVPGLTDNEEELHELAAFVSTLRNVQRVGIMPFHQLGAHKWATLGLNYKLKDTQPPSPEETERVRELFRKYGISVIT